PFGRPCGQRVARGADRRCRRGCRSAHMRSEPEKCGRASGPASTAVTWSPRSGFGYLNVRRGEPLGVGRGRSIPPILSSPIGFADPLKPRYRDIDGLRAEYEAKQDAIRARLEDFRRTGHKADERLFEELCFCIVAIQSKARASDSAVAALRTTQLLWFGGPDEIGIPMAALDLLFWSRETGEIFK